MSKKITETPMLRYTTYLLFIVGLLISCTNPKTEEEKSTSEKIENPTNKVLLSSKIIWEKLNPARGDQSPQAGTIWGNRKGTEATGFLAKFVDGFSSPPHIHNVTYRAVVIKGLVHNDDAEAEHMWMKSGSFWTQPEGEAHITSAKGEENIALVEIDHGPYLVKPISEAFDNGERPVNIDVSNLVWLDNEKSNWIDPSSNAELCFLLEDNGLKSLFVKLPKGYNGEIETDGTVLHSVVIKGELIYLMPTDNEKKVLDPGSYFGSTGRSIHSIQNNSDQEIVLYFRTDGEVKIK